MLKQKTQLYKILNSCYANQFIMILHRSTTVKSGQISQKQRNYCQKVSSSTRLLTVVFILCVIMLYEIGRNFIWGAIFGLERSVLVRAS